MKHNNKILYRLLREGRATLQIQYLTPEKAFLLLPVEAPTETLRQWREAEEDYPDEWFWYLTYQGEKRRICIGREEGFWYWSPRGWSSNGKRILEAFREGARESGWYSGTDAELDEAFRKDANPEGLWREVIAASQAHVERLQRKLKAAQMARQRAQEGIGG